MNRLSKKWLSSDRGCTQVMGAMILKGRLGLTLLLLVMVALSLLSLHNWQNAAFLSASSCLTSIYGFISTALRSSWYWLVLLTLLMFLVIGVCNTMTNIYSLRKNETGITWCQIMILIFVGIWLIGILCIIKIQKESGYFIIFGVLGTLMTWIFQDTIKGVVAFVHLRLNHLLYIDDWIQVSKLNVDGEVKRITLTTVTLYNWDTTISSIPTSVLHNDHFINLQRMTDGKTYGRQMLKTFILDTGGFHPLTPEEIESLKQREEVKAYLLDEDFKVGELNAHLFRLYVFHWLMNHPYVSQEPRLVVRWLEQKETGLPLQIYGFIMEGGVLAYEWQQSQIIEHIVEALDWFGLQLYQRPSSHDVSNLTEKVLMSRKEETL
ncbi:MAG: mechanosensitive ion channel [Bacteroidales bacterium]|nr:mechanosensitive ion channel [Bacteroidales bacterium]